MTPRPLRPIDGVTAAVDQLQCEVRSLEDQVSILCMCVCCLTLVVVLGAARKGVKA